ncbi:MAG: metallophosphatase family protein [Chloroflexaceae bacterium]|jgi:putative phosphoesterase|nr:metallophosphatase family protein [Chloroflexaceae bacterium]
MRIVIFSDVHGNAAALEAVLADVRRNAAPDLIIGAGDYASDGPRPAESLALLRGLGDARFVKGNMDEAVVHGGGEELDFTRSKLGADDMRWLEELPFSQVVEAAPGQSLLVVHANPRDLHAPMRPNATPDSLRPLLQGVSQQLIAFGHVHIPYIRQLDDVTLVDVSSVGLPRDGLLRAVYVTLTFAGGAWQIAHHRISFDSEAVARDYEAVGYPKAKKMAQRLLAATY